MSDVPGLSEQFDRVTGRDRFGREWPPPGERIASSTPNLDKWMEHAAEVTGARSFVMWMEEHRGLDLQGWRDDWLAEWIGVDPMVLEEEKRWVARQQQKAARRKE